MAICRYRHPDGDSQQKNTIRWLRPVQCDSVAFLFPISCGRGPAGEDPRRGGVWTLPAPGRGRDLPHVPAAGLCDLSDAGQLPRSHGAAAAAGPGRPAVQRGQPETPGAGLFLDRQGTHRGPGQRQDRTPQAAGGRTRPLAPTPAGHAGDAGVDLRLLVGHRALRGPLRVPPGRRIPGASTGCPGLERLRLCQGPADLGGGAWRWCRARTRPWI